MIRLNLFYNLSPYIKKKNKQKKKPKQKKNKSDFKGTSLNKTHSVGFNHDAELPYKK